MRKSNRLSLNMLALSVATMLFLPSVASCKTIDPANSGVYIGANYGVGIANKIGGEYKYDEGKYLKPRRPDNSQIFGLALGYKFDDNVRAELAVNHFHNFKFKHHVAEKDNSGSVLDMHFDQKISANALFTNLYFDFSEFEKFTPYINMGMGIFRNKLGNLNADIKQDEADIFNVSLVKKNSKNKLAYNIGAGVTCKFNDKVSWELINYRYYNLGRTSTKPDDDGDIYTAKLRIHSINTGIRFNFN